MFSMLSLLGICVLQKLAPLVCLADPDLLGPLRLSFHPFCLECPIPTLYLVTTHRPSRADLTFLTPKPAIGVQHSTQ